VGDVINNGTTGIDLGLVFFPWYLPGKGSKKRSDFLYRIDNMNILPII
jgi:hypothetical protein